MPAFSPAAFAFCRSTDFGYFIGSTPIVRMKMRIKSHDKERTEFAFTRRLPRKGVPMSKLSRQARDTRETNPEGGYGALRDIKSELFLLGVTNMVTEETFYESSAARDARFADLVHTVTNEDPEWVARFLPWLRTDANMRTASIIGAVEYARELRKLNPEARKDLYAQHPHATVRAVVNGVVQRPDEVGELVSYWLTGSGGGTLPGGIQRGLQDAIVRLFTERSSLKYDGVNQPKRYGDLIRIIHPHPQSPYQTKLFAYLVDKAIRGNEAPIPEELTILQANRALHEANGALHEIPQGERRQFLTSTPDIGDVLS